MVVLNKIYTRTGDDGTSGLGTGERRLKSDLRFAAIGTVDELNATIGLARIETKEGRAELDAMLARVQNDLFDLGADLAVPAAEEKRERLRVSATQVDRLEREIDQLNAELSPLNSFVLPGGTPLAAALHFCRTVARRAERLLVELDARESVNRESLRYLNRLSDALFVLARFANDKGEGDVLWVPGKNR
jgi:cob(I)alamin adenosyltransferase